MRFLRRSLSGLFLTALTLGLLLWAAALVRDAVEVRMADDPPQPEGRERVFSVNVVLPVAETLRPVLTAYGEVRTRRELELRAGVGGRIVELAPSMAEGGRVEAGTLLARIDPADAEAALDRARSDLEDAEAEGREARRAVGLAEETLGAAEDEAELYATALDRQRDLGDRGVGSVSAVEQAELNAASARATVIQRRQALAEAEARVAQSQTLLRRARIAVAEAERRVSDTEIRADFAGVLSEVSVVEGRLVSENEQVARLIDPNALEVAFRVSTEAYARLLDEAGELRPSEATVTLEVQGADLVAEGRLDRVAGSVAAGETGRVIYADLGRTPGFRPGDFVTVRVTETPMAGLARLPATALGADGTVLEIGSDDRLRAVPVTLVRRQRDDVLVAADPVAGRQVVAQRTPLLGLGVKVRAIGPALSDTGPAETSADGTEQDGSGDADRPAADRGAAPGAESAATAPGAPAGAGGASQSSDGAGAPEPAASASGDESGDGTEAGAGAAGGDGARAATRSTAPVSGEPVSPTAAHGIPMLDRLAGRSKPRALDRLAALQIPPVVVARIDTRFGG